MGGQSSKNEQPASDPKVKNTAGTNQPTEKAGGKNPGAKRSNDDDRRRGRDMDEYHDYFQGLTGQPFSGCPVAFYDTIPPLGEVPNMVSGCPLLPGSE